MERENESTKGGKRWIKKGKEEDEAKEKESRRGTEKEREGGREGELSPPHYSLSLSLPSAAPGISLGSILGLGDGRLH